MRPRVKKGLLELLSDFGDKLTFRISLDHFQKDEHDRNRGDENFENPLEELRGLKDNEFSTSVTGRILWLESDEKALLGYRGLFETEAFDTNTFNPLQT